MDVVWKRHTELTPRSHAIVCDDLAKDIGNDHVIHIGKDLASPNRIHGFEGADESNSSLLIAETIKRESSVLENEIACCRIELDTIDLKNDLRRIAQGNPGA